jgi:hypothetical protein
MGKRETKDVELHKIKNIFSIKSKKIILKIFCCAYRATLLPLLSALEKEGKNNF